MLDDIDFKMERAKLIERARLEKRWTKKQLAERAGYDEKTLYNLLTGGEVQSKTVFDFCEALQIEVPVPAIRKLEVAADLLGGYSRSTYDEYEGDFHVYRPSFSDHGKIYKYALRITWDEADSAFRFTTFYKIDPREPHGAKTHGGPVSISAITNLVHFVVTYRGSVRLVTVTKMRNADGVMRGAMATHFEDFNYFRPTLTPIVIRKIGQTCDDLVSPEHIRMLGADDPDLAFATEQLSLTQARVLNLCFKKDA